MAQSFETLGEKNTYHSSIFMDYRQKLAVVLTLGNVGDPCAVAIMLAYGDHTSSSDRSKLENHVSHYNQVAI